MRGSYWHKSQYLPHTQTLYLSRGIFPFEFPRCCFPDGSLLFKKGLLCKNPDLFSPLFAPLSTSKVLQKAVPEMEALLTSSRKEYIEFMKESQDRIAQAVRQRSMLKNVPRNKCVSARSHLLSTRQNGLPLLSCATRQASPRTQCRKYFCTKKV